LQRLVDLGTADWHKQPHQQTYIPPLQQYCSLPWNKLADQKTKEASTVDSSAQPVVSLSSAVSCIKQIILDPETQHTWTAAVYTECSEQRDQHDCTRLFPDKMHSSGLITACITRYISI